MALVTVAFYVAVVVAAGVGAIVFARYLMEQLRRTKLPYAKRAQIDRRHIRSRVAVERRNGPRREDEVASQFLTGLARRNMPRRTKRRLRPGSGEPFGRSA